VPGPAAADAALRHVRAQDRAGRVRAMQADAAAVPPPRLRLRQAGAALPRATLQVRKRRPKRKVAFFED
jgi:hypothetical protein